MSRMVSYSGRPITGRPMRLMWHDVPGCPPGGTQTVPEELTSLYEAIPHIAQGLLEGTITRVILDDGEPEPLPPAVFTYGEGLVSLDEAEPTILEYGFTKRKVRKMLHDGDIVGAYKAGNDANDPWVIPLTTLEAHLKALTQPEPEPEPEPAPPEE